MSNKKQLKLISLVPKIIINNRPLEQVDSSEISEQDDEVIIASFLTDRAEDAIENLSELVAKVHTEVSKACQDLNWEAELEIGLEFGVKFNAKLKISPKKTPN